MHLSPCGRNLKVLSLEYRNAKNLMSISFPVHPPSSTKLYSSRSGCLLLPSQPQCLLLSFSTSGSRVLICSLFNTLHQYQFSRSVVSDSLRPHGLQHSRLPCPSAAPGACSNSCLIELVMPSNHLSLCHPLLLLPSVFPSIRVFSNESALRIHSL